MKGDDVAWKVISFMVFSPFEEALNRWAECDHLPVAEWYKCIVRFILSVNWKQHY